MKILNTISWILAVGMAASLAMIMPAFAQTAPSGQQGGGAWGSADEHGLIMRNGAAPGIFGTVSAVNGDTLTVTSVERIRPEATVSATSSVVYTVDASNAKIYKGSATTTVSVSDIATGDTVMVQGTISGTNIIATVIRDGVFPRSTGGPWMPGRGFDRGASSTSSTVPAIHGNGEPVVGGSVTAISGTTLTITNTSNVTYTIDAAAATVVVRGATSTLASVAVGDNIIVQGTVSGNLVTASSIIDQGTRPASVSSGGASSSAPRGNAFGLGVGIGGFFGAIGGFFRHLFGF